MVRWDVEELPWRGAAPYWQNRARLSVLALLERECFI